MQETLDGNVKAHFTCFDIYCCAKSTFCWIVYILTKYDNILFRIYYLELYIIIQNVDIRLCQKLISSFYCTHLFITYITKFYTLTAQSVLKFISLEFLLFYFSKIISFELFLCLFWSRIISFQSFSCVNILYMSIHFYSKILVTFVKVTYYYEQASCCSSKCSLSGEE